MELGFHHRVSGRRVGGSICCRQSQIVRSVNYMRAVEYTAIKVESVNFSGFIYCQQISRDYFRESKTIQHGRDCGAMRGI